MLAEKNPLIYNEIKNRKEIKKRGNPMKTIDMAGHVLGETQSICPVCHRPVRAFYMAEAEESPSECCDGEPPVYSYEA